MSRFEVPGEDLGLFVDWLDCCAGLCLDLRSFSSLVNRLISSFSKLDFCPPTGGTQKHIQLALSPHKDKS